jgi:hypothetical protein
MATSKTPSKAAYSAGDYRPAPNTKALTKPIFNAADYRPGWGSEVTAHGGGKGGGKKKAKAVKKPKIWGPSRRLAPGAVDPWHGARG